MFYLTKSANFVSLVFSLLPKDPSIKNLFFFNAADAVLCGAVKGFHVHHYNNFMEGSGSATIK